jgi:hypothetical protein
MYVLKLLIFVGKICNWQCSVQYMEEDRDFNERKVRKKEIEG